MKSAMNNRIIELFQNYLSKTATDLEKRELNLWIASNSELQEWLEMQLRESENVMDEAQQIRILENIHRKIDKQNQKKFAFPSWLKNAAAIALVLITTGSIFYAIRSNKSEPTYYSSVEAMRGQKSNITLPDGTKVILNSESTLKYNTDFNQKSREIALDGEAFFEVAKNTNLPFVVQVGNLSIKAVGTAFNVRAYSNENIVSTTLTEGKVSVKTPYETMDLIPNERMEFSRDEKKLEKIQLENAKLSLGWLNDQLSFENTTLAVVASNLSRIYNIEIELSSESIKQQRFTGIISNNSLQSVLRILSLTSPIRYTIKDNKVILYEVKDERKLFGEN